MQEPLLGASKRRTSKLLPVLVTHISIFVLYTFKSPLFVGLGRVGEHKRDLSINMDCLKSNNFLVHSAMLPGMYAESTYNTLSFMPETNEGGDVVDQKA